MMDKVEEATASRRARMSVLVVNDRDEIAPLLRDRFPSWEVGVCDSYLSAIGALSQAGGGSVDAVFAYVDASADDLDGAVAGLREAAGAGTRLVLCCHPEAEPLARSVLGAGAGANDYLICPLRADEIEAAMGLCESAAARGAAGGSDRSPPSVSMDELTALGEIVARLEAPAEEFLRSLARFLRAAFDSVSAGVVVGETAATTGAGVSEPVMTEPLMEGTTRIGHVALGPAASGRYADTDRAKLCHFARLIGQLVSAAGDHRRFHDLAYTDELSGLPNRRYLMGFLDRLLREAEAAGSTVTLLMFDVDSFKQYNDTFGHDAGDEIIRGCGELFRRNCREHDLVTRYGGDEFAVVFWDKGGRREPGSRHPSDVLPIIERFRRSLQTHDFGRFNVHEGSRLTISGGLASFPADATTRDELIRHADQALLKAKREGKNRIFVGGEDVCPAPDTDRAEERLG